VLWDITSNSPRTFALSTLPHIISLSTPKLDAKQALQDAYPLGTVLDSIKVTRVESEWGLVCEAAKGAPSFVHVSLLILVLSSAC
jgi:rRNA biogenesis protein RRP5